MDCWFYEQDCKLKDTKKCNTWCDKYLLFLTAQKQSGIPKRYNNCFIYNYPKGPNRMVALKLIDRLSELDKGHGFYIFASKVGNGKTTLATTIANEYIASKLWTFQGDPLLLYVKTPELLDSMRNDFSSIKDTIDSINSAPVVVWDDVGVEKTTDWVIEKLYTMIDARYSEELANVFTSNLNLSDLETRLGSRIVSRIIAMTEPVELAGQDYRRGF